ncbi:MAG: Hpt domain-containing protein [Thermoanaerobaculia bacterium]
MDEEFAELRREFLVEADEKVRDIKRAWTSGSPEERVALERMIYLAHQLKGAGGSYGFQTISTEAAALENALEEKLTGSEAAAPRIESRIKGLSNEVDTLIRENAPR